MRLPALPYGAFLLCAIIFVCSSCQPDEPTPLFTLIEPARSGIKFANVITENDSIHYFNFPYIYTGAGVGVADFDNDGLQDIFFSGNMVSPRLYLNLGDLTFEDITLSSGVETNRWTTGVSIVDINQDGWQDIYLSVGGHGPAITRKNLLFINNHNLTFTEAAEIYGIADDGHSTQSGFFDYDRDGDLDLYIMTHANENYAAISKLSTRKDGSGPSTDRLYQNQGFSASGLPFYKDVSSTAGITIEGYGLGLAFSDLNLDGWLDIYVANDFIASDLFYVNNRDGTFTNQLSEHFNHTSQNGMGIDIGDLNTDGLPDVLVMDMLPRSNARQKTMTSKMNYDYFQRTLKQGFAPQFIRNTLQLHRGITKDGQPVFSEVGRLAGLHETDWSWAPLLADFDLDGRQDVYITNGFRRDVTNHDFQEYSKQGDVFENRTGKLSVENVTKRLYDLDSVSLPNYLFANHGGLNFSDETVHWGMGQNSISQGSAYADLDNDGDLDLVINNMNEPAFLYENHAAQLHPSPSIKIKLIGLAGNIDGLGAILTFHLSDGAKMRFENNPVRGYLSCSELGIHTGLQAGVFVDTLTIVWPDGVENTHTNLSIDTLVHLNYSQQKPILDDPNKKKYLFDDLTQQLNLNYRHRENDHSDFRLEPLLLHLNDHNGPGIAIGDVNGDELIDFYIGGARFQAGSLCTQNRDGTFSIDTLEGSNMYEDMGALLIDIARDEDLDLYVVSGGSSIKYFDKGHYQDRLYLNDGRGNFEWSPDILPEIRASGSCVVAADFDQDNDLDLFVGGRIVPGRFPVAPRSYLLENRKGKFFDRTEEWAPGLATVGMVNSALWSDYDNDHDFDLVIAGEWMPITIFENTNGMFVNQTSTSGLLQYKGWWNSLLGADLDSDGDIDFIAGNQGENTIFKASGEQPVRVYHHDFDRNSYEDAIVTRFIEGKEYPIAPRGALIDQVSSIQRAFPNYDEFSKAEMTEIISVFDTSGMVVLEANHLSSSFIENLGGGQFRVRPLPLEAQLAPIYGTEINDYDLDGHLDVLCIGNFYQTEVISGWYDAGKGILLHGDGQGNFRSTSGVDNGFLVNGGARALTSLPLGSNMINIATINDSHLKFFERLDTLGQQTVLLHQDDAWGELILDDGRKRKLEFYHGQSYLSQAARVFLTDSHNMMTLENQAGDLRSITLKQLEK